MKPHIHQKEIIAWANGAEIEYSWSDDKDNWATANNPTWRESTRYRIKPQPKPKLVPFSFEDAEFLIGHIIKRKYTSYSMGMITIVNASTIIVGGGIIPFDTLLKDYVFLDDSPCGKVVLE